MCTWLKSLFGKKSCCEGKPCCGDHKTEEKKADEVVAPKVDETVAPKAEEVEEVK
jgi:hypothetical protein